MSACADVGDLSTHADEASGRRPAGSAAPARRDLARQTPGLSRVGGETALLTCGRTGAARPQHVQTLPIAAIAADQWANSTPCTDGDVRALVVHLVTGNHGFAAAFGSAPSTSADLATQPAPDVDLVGAYRASAASTKGRTRNPWL